MESRAKLLGHSVHQILIVFPLGLLATAVVFDAIFLGTDRDVFATVAYWMMIAGCIGGLIAAPFGTIDWLAIPPGTRAKRVGLMHAVSNVLALLLFGASAYLRRTPPHQPSSAALWLSLGGVVLAFLGGWLGGELVARLGVAVDDGAHLDAPNSLSGRPARDEAAGAKRMF